jgi:putative transposase
MAYPTDLTDAQWKLVEPLIPIAKFGGRPRTTDMRRTVDGLMYLIKTGCHWRMLPEEFQPWQNVYRYFAAWGANGILRHLQARLVANVRQTEGRSKHPSIVVVDSQSVKTSKMGGLRGYDGGKRVKGRKRHIAVDSLGLLLAVSVTPANVHDLRGGKRVLGHVAKLIKGRPLRTVYADGGYNGEPFRTWVRDTFSAKVEIAANLALKFKEFVPVSQRWVVERTFAWLSDYRRLTIDYERTLQHSRFMIRLAAIRLMLCRLRPG